MCNNFENFGCFSILMETKHQRRFGSTSFFDGFDRAEKTAQDAPKEVCKIFAHSTFILSKRSRNILLHESVHVSRDRTCSLEILRSCPISYIYCKGKCFMNNGASHFKKYWTLDFPGPSHEKFYKRLVAKGEGVRMRLYLEKRSSGEPEIFSTHTS